MKFLARLHGFKIDTPSAAQKKDDRMTWGTGKYSGCNMNDPTTYSHLSDVEVGEFSNQMMEKYRREFGGIFGGKQ